MNLTLSYQTLMLPPPHAHAYVVNATSIRDHLKVHFQSEYLGREELTEDEILSEGYTPNDDFVWSGRLGKAWLNRLEAALETVVFGETPEGSNHYLHIQTEISEGIVTDPEPWYFLLQELLQAIYEESGLEKPLEIRFRYLDNGGSKDFLLEASFAQLRSSVNGKQIAWQRFLRLLNDVYIMDFEEGGSKSPNSNGLWISPDSQNDFQHFEKKAGPRAHQISQRILQNLHV